MGKYKKTGRRYRRAVFLKIKKPSGAVKLRRKRKGSKVIVEIFDKKKREIVDCVWEVRKVWESGETFYIEFGGLEKPGLIELDALEVELKLVY